MLEGIVFAAVYTRTRHPRRVPHIRAEQVDRPEGPGSALVGTRVVNFAAFARRGSFQEDTVVAGFLFDKAVAGYDEPAVFFLHLLIGKPEIFGDKFHLSFSQPYVTFFRSAAASAAAGTLKVQTADIPFVFFLTYSFVQYTPMYSLPPRRSLKDSRGGVFYKMPRPSGRNLNSSFQTGQQVSLSITI